MIVAMILMAVPMLPKPEANRANVSNLNLGRRKRTRGQIGVRTGTRRCRPAPYRPFPRRNRKHAKNHAGGLPEARTPLPPRFCRRRVGDGSRNLSGFPNKIHRIGLLDCAKPRRCGGCSPGCDALGLTSFAKIRGPVGVYDLVHPHRVQRRLDDPAKAKVVFGAAPDAIVLRLIRCVRSGPNRPVPPVLPIAWQFTHAVVSKTRLPETTFSS